MCVDRVGFTSRMCLWMARRCKTRGLLVECGGAYRMCDVLIKIFWVLLGRVPGAGRARRGRSVI